MNQIGFAMFCCGTLLTGPVSASPVRLDQLQLAVTWLAVYMDRVASTTAGSPTHLTPVLLAMLISAVKLSIFQAPVSVHDDCRPRATELRLSLLARLTVHQRYW